MLRLFWCCFKFLIWTWFALSNYVCWTHWDIFSSTLQMTICVETWLFFGLARPFPYRFFCTPFNELKNPQFKKKIWLLNFISNFKGSPNSWRGMSCYGHVNASLVLSNFSFHLVWPRISNLIFLSLVKSWVRLLS